MKLLSVIHLNTSLHAHELPAVCIAFTCTRLAAKDIHHSGSRVAGHFVQLAHTGEDDGPLSGMTLLHEEQRRRAEVRKSAGSPHAAKATGGWPKVRSGASVVMHCPRTRTMVVTRSWRYCMTKRCDIEAAANRATEFDSAADTCPAGPRQKTAAGEKAFSIPAGLRHIPISKGDLPPEAEHP